MPKLRHKPITKLTLLSVASKMFAAVGNKKANDKLLTMKKNKIKHILMHENVEEINKRSKGNDFP